VAGIKAFKTLEPTDACEVVAICNEGLVVRYNLDYLANVAGSIVVGLNNGAVSASEGFRWQNTVAIQDKMLVCKSSAEQIVGVGTRGFSVTRYNITVGVCRSVVVKNICLVFSRQMGFRSFPKGESGVGL
jgi:hypothetical protein